MCDLEPVLKYEAATNTAKQKRKWPEEQPEILRVPIKSEVKNHATKCQEVA